MAKVTIAQELEAACLERDGLKLERDGALSKLAEMAEVIKALESRVDELAKNDSEAAASQSALVEKLAEVTASRDSLSVELEKLKAAASLNPVPDVTGEKPVDAAPVAAEVVDVREKFAAIIDPVERTAFYRKHSAELWRPKAK